MQTNSLTGVGVGLRHKHFAGFIEHKPKVPWLEVHTENFIYAGSNASKYLDIIRQDYPISAHCVGLSLGSQLWGAQQQAHLIKIKETVERIKPAVISDHLSWSHSGNSLSAPDLFPIPYTQAALAVICQNIDRVQSTLGREILIENPSSYLSYKHAEMTESEFLAQLSHISGCGILLDVNNLYVSAFNHQFDSKKYLQGLPKSKIKELHLAGFSILNIEDKPLYLDTHGHPVHDEVWQLYQHVIKQLGPIPTLIEWDNNVPKLDDLLHEQAKAQVFYDSYPGVHHGAG